MSLCDSVGQVPDLPSEAPSAPWQVGDLPHGGSCRFPIDSEMPGNLRRSESRHGTQECVRHVLKTAFDSCSAYRAILDYNNRAMKAIAVFAALCLCGLCPAQQRDYPVKPVP